MGRRRWGAATILQKKNVVKGEGQMGGASKGEGVVCGVCSGGERLGERFTMACWIECNSSRCGDGLFITARELNHP